MLTKKQVLLSELFERYVPDDYITEDEIAAQIYNVFKIDVLLIRKESEEKARKISDLYFKAQVEKFIKENPRYEVIK